MYGALTMHCTQCGGPIAAEAKSCPSCGEPILFVEGKRVAQEAPEKKSSRTLIFGGSLVVVILLAIYGALHFEVMSPTTVFELARTALPDWFSEKPTASAPQRKSHAPAARRAKARTLAVDGKGYVRLSGALGDIMKEKAEFATEDAVFGGKGSLRVVVKIDKGYMRAIYPKYPDQSVHGEMAIFGDDQVRCAGVFGDGSHYWGLCTGKKPAMLEATNGPSVGTYRTAPGDFFYVESSGINRVIYRLRFQKS